MSRHWNLPGFHSAHLDSTLRIIDWQHNLDTGLLLHVRPSGTFLLLGQQASCIAPLVGFSVRLEGGQGSFNRKKAVLIGRSQSI